ncbi:MAG: hypothetical protein COA78_28860 [Blastopirellula sp.]|nr:MAG: hypothetical protein COA78_28860 [Blastopirellula sp.]
MPSKNLISLLILLTPLLGCVEQTNVATQESEESPVQPSKEPKRVIGSVEQLQGVYPNPPLILVTDAYEFQSSKNGQLIVCSDQRGVGLWDITTGTRTRLIQQTEIVLNIALLESDDALLTIATGRTTPARLWSLKTGKLLKEYPSPFNLIDATPQNQEKEQGGSQWKDTDSWRCATSGIVPEAGFGFTCAAFDSNETTLATGCEDGRIILWDVKSAKQIKTIATGVSRIHSIKFSARGNRLLAAARDDIIQLWNLDENAKIREFKETRIEREIWVNGYRPAIAFSNDGSKFALYSPKLLAIRVCDSSTGDDLLRLPETSRHPRGHLQISLQRGLAFVDETTLFSNTGGQIKLWDITNGNLVQQKMCNSGVNVGYEYPHIHYLKFLPEIDAFVAAEVENDENTHEADWTVISFHPRKLLEVVP